MGIVGERSVRAAKKTTANADALRIRRVLPADIPGIIALDRQVTGLAKPGYWREAFKTYSRRRAKDGIFLVAEDAISSPGKGVLGFIIGEVRAWEFGSEPCGWVFALSVDPSARVRGVGEALFEAVAAELKKAGVSKMRTMVARDNRLPMLFFRGMGMVAGPYIQLEKELD